MSGAKRLLVLDDEPDIAEIIVTVARRLGYEAEAVGTARAFEERFAALRPDLIVLDIVMPDKDGAAMVEWLVAQGCTARVVLATGHNAAVAEVARTTGLRGGLASVSVLDKPFELARLRACLAEGLAG